MKKMNSQHMKTNTFTNKPLGDVAKYTVMDPKETIAGIVVKEKVH